MQRVIIVGLLSILSVGVMVAQSVSDSALGSWTLNHAKSTFSGAVPYRRVTKFEVVGDAIKETTYTMSTNKPSVLVEYTARFDGKDYPISNSILSTVSLKRVDDQTVERTGKIQGQVVETETRTVSDNGKVLTVTTKGSRDGTEYSSVQVYDRQRWDLNAVSYLCGFCSCRAIGDNRLPPIPTLTETLRRVWKTKRRRESPTRSAVLAMAAR